LESKPAQCASLIAPYYAAVISMDMRVELRVTSQAAAMASVAIEQR
jgi:hypothetical protein